MEIICYAAGKGEYPGNTIEAIKNCQLVNKNWWIEIDLQLTKDNEIILFHENDLQRITGLKIKISELSLSEIKNWNAKHNAEKDKSSKTQIPTLEAVFLRFPQAKFILDIHTRNIKIIDQLMRLLCKYSISEQQIVVVSRYNSIKVKFRNQESHFKYAASAYDIKKLLMLNFFGLSALIEAPAPIVMMPFIYQNKKILTPKILKFAQKKQVQVWLWFSEGRIVETVNSKRLVEKFQKMNINGIFTSFPKKLSRELASK